jgi:hypothetical protein
MSVAELLRLPADVGSVIVDVELFDASTAAAEMDAQAGKEKLNREMKRGMT